MIAIVNIVNVQSGKDLITVDLRTSQIRFVESFFGDAHKMLSKPVRFYNLSYDDVSGYDALFNDNKKKFLKVLSEEVHDIFGVKVKDLKFVKLQ